MPPWVAILTAGTLALLGLIILARALFHDRARGRRRCPRCWYDMTGAASLACPECGRTARFECHLLKTRRRYPRAAAGLLLIAIAACTYQVCTRGLVRSIPTPLYIAALPSIDNADALAEIQRRVNQGELAPWKLRWLFRATLRTIAANPAAPEVRQHLQVLERILITHLGHSHLFHPRPELTPDDLHNAVTTLVTSIPNPTPTNDTRACLNWLALTEGGEIAVVPMIMLEDGVLPGIAHSHGLLFNLTPSVAIDATSPMVNTGLRPQLRRAGLDRVAVIKVLSESLDPDDWAIFTTALWALSLLAPSDPDVRTHVLSYRRHSAPPVRLLVLGFVASAPLDDAARVVLRHAVADPVHEVQEFALRLAANAQHDPQLRDAVGSIMNRGRTESAGALAAIAWVKLGGDPQPALRTLHRVLHEQRFGTRVRTALRGLRIIGDRSPESLAAIQPHLDAQSPRTRIRAIQTAASLGAPRDTTTQLALQTFQSTPSALRRHLEEMVADGLLDLTQIEPWLTDPEPARRQWGLELLTHAGPAAKPFLPKMRRLFDDPDKSTASAARLFVRSLEWQIANPQLAAQRRRDERNQLPFSDD